MNPKLSYFVRDGFRRTLYRIRTRLLLRMGNPMPYYYPVGKIVGFGWEGDKFVVNVR